MVGEESSVPGSDELGGREIAALGDGAITVRFGDAIDPDIYRMVRAFSSLLEERPLPAMLEVVAAYASVTVFYDVAAAAKLAKGAGEAALASKLARVAGETASTGGVNAVGAANAAERVAGSAGTFSPYEWMRNQVEATVEQLEDETPIPSTNATLVHATTSTPHSAPVSLPNPYTTSAPKSPSTLAATFVPAMASLPPSPTHSGGSSAARTVDIPVCYGGEFGPDLDEVAELCGLTAVEVVALHAGGEYLAYMIGFAPGFPYLGGLPDQLVVPRKAAPRLHVPAGSVGLAGKQTGVYPQDSPGGWQIIGRTPIRLFTPERTPPTLLQAGDVVRFRAISCEEYGRLAAGEEQL
jgi:allophanate hydrolase subunit 1